MLRIENALRTVQWSRDCAELKSEPDGRKRRTLNSRVSYDGKMPRPETEARSVETNVGRPFKAGIFEARGIRRVATFERGSATTTGAAFVRRYATGSSCERTRP